MQRFLIPIVIVCVLAGAGVWWRFFSQGQFLRWLVCYSPEIAATSLHDADWAIVDAAVDPKKLRDAGAKLIAYVSIGEAEESRAYWPRIKASNAIVASNPDWPGAWRIDVRSEVWRQLILDEIIPAIAAKGFDGVFLDTLDVAPYLEASDPERFKGCRDAVIALVHEIRKRYPAFVIIPNNALELLPDYGDAVDAAFVEDLYTRYDFETKTYGETPADVTAEKELVLDEFVRRTGLPVLTVLYAGSFESDLALRATKRAQAKGYDWYLTDVNLMSVGKMRGD